MQLQARLPARKGNKRGAAYAYNIKELRDREIDVVRHAEHAYEQFVSRCLRVLASGARVPAMRSDGDGCAAGLTSSIPALCHVTLSSTIADRAAEKTS